MTTENLNPGNAISPIDGRYRKKTEELSEMFSEKALMKARLIVEVEYFISLSKIAGIIRELTPHEIGILHKIYKDFSDEGFAKIQSNEKITNHDVKAVEYFLKDKIIGTSLEDLKEFVHIGRTSEDINNLAYAIMLRTGTGVLIGHYLDVKNKIHDIGNAHLKSPLLARTHGQPASPTTFGRQMMVFVNRLEEDLHILVDGKFKMLVKCNGATGGDNAMYAAYPDINWAEFSEKFIKHLDKIIGHDLNSNAFHFKNNPVTTQIEPHDTYRRLFDLLKGMNNILIDFCVDIWMYVSNEILVQTPVDGEVGSSAMPQKINPINFENAEGNLEMANAMFEYFGRKLTRSRLQRDLSDSTIERNFGVAFAHTLIGLKAIVAGLKRVNFNHTFAEEELENNWAVISEAYQTILKSEGLDGAYEMLLKETRGKKVTKKLMHDFVHQLFENNSINAGLAKKLKKITPANYIGEVQAL